jgi:hypothetical protein
MPLHDHFRPPISNRSSWDGVHGGWPMMIVIDLQASYEQTCHDLRIV